MENNQTTQQASDAKPDGQQQDTAQQEVTLETLLSVEQVLGLCREAARAHPEEYIKDPNTFMPHDWVMVAVNSAFYYGIMVGGKSPEIAENVKQRVVDELKRVVAEKIKEQAETPVSQLPENAGTESAAT